jgi:hypothetical protein
MPQIEKTELNPFFLLSKKMKGVKRIKIKY